MVASELANVDEGRPPLRARAQPPRLDQDGIDRVGLVSGATDL